MTIGETKFEADVAALYISEPPHALSKACQIALQRLRGSGAQNSDHRHRRLLRARRERPGRRAAEQRDELAAPHSITSSASNWIEFGTSMPSALAVCRLMTNSNLVACKTE